MENVSDQLELKMFYGIPVDKKSVFERAMGDLQSIYPTSFHGQDMLVTFWKHLSFRSDARFMDSFNAEARTQQEQSLLWRLHVLSWAARTALRVEGDFVECGVLHGFSSAVLCRYLAFGELSRRFYLYDTFSGLPESTSTEQERRNWNPAYQQVEPDALYAQVCARFAGYPNVDVVRGTVPESFDFRVPEKIAFLHIDMNSARAELLALDALFDRVVAGGVIVFDDFGWMINSEQTAAEREFMDAREHPILELPTGQGLVLKGATPR